MSGLLLSKDLMFGSRVAAAARQLGVSVIVAGTAPQLAEKRPDDVRLVMIDLFGSQGDDLAAIVNTLSDTAGDRPHVVAYGPHVDEALLESARQAGCDEVLTRGQFHQQMPEILAKWLTPPA